MVVVLFSFGSTCELFRLVKNTVLTQKEQIHGGYSMDISFLTGNINVFTNVCVNALTDHFF